MVKAPMTLTLEARALGRKPPLVTDWSLPLPDGLWGDKPLSLRELLEHVVRCEVRAFRERQERGQFLRILSEEQIEAGAAGGKIDSGGRALQQDVDENEAVRTAVQAFADGIYMVLIDGEEQRELDEAVPLRPGSRVTFLRLVLLAGG